MADSKLSFNLFSFSYLLLFLFFYISITNDLISQESKLTTKQEKVLKDTYSYLEKLDGRKLKIDKTTYQKLSHFEEYFKFSFSGKKLSKWIQSRIKSVSYGSTGDFLAMYNEEEVTLGKIFFTLSPLDRTLVLLHEARHADGKQYAHVLCPETFVFLNPRDWRIQPANKKGCDKVWDGSYGITAAFLFELGAFGYLSQTEAGLRYNSEISRVITNLK